MKPKGGGDSPADEEKLVIQTGCSGKSSIFHFAGEFFVCFNSYLILFMSPVKGFSKRALLHLAWHVSGNT